MSNKIPVEPDPFWPKGAAPTHLGPEEQRNDAIVASFVDTTGVWTCQKCGTAFNKSSSDERYCNDCYKLEAKNSAVAKRINADWMEQSKECGLAVYERQPEETDEEWRIWTAYRAHYPLQLPTWTTLARECHVSNNTVVRVASKWSFRVRIQAWARSVDGELQQDRIEAIQEMNKNQLSMAERLQAKISEAIDNIDPALLRPGEIVNLMKVSTELERKIKLAVPEKVHNEEVSTGKQVAQTKVEDLSEVINILHTTGAFEGKIIGVEQTTRLVAKEAD